MPILHVIKVIDFLGKLYEILSTLHLPQLPILTMTIFGVFL
jgi:hypothetical protein